MPAPSLLLLWCLLAPNLPAALSYIAAPLPKDRCAPSNSMFHLYCNCSADRGLGCGGTIDVEFLCRNLPELFEEDNVNSDVQCL